MRYLSIIISIVKSFFLCIKLFGFKKGVKIPLLVSSSTKVKAKKGSIDISETVSKRRVKLGFSGSEGVAESSKGSLIINGSGKLIFKGNASIAKGFSIRIEDNGVLSIGDNFCANKNIFISASNEITIGDDVVIGWNAEIRDSNGHTIVYENNISSVNNKNVYIGNDVWLASYTLIMGNSHISSNSVVGMRSMTNKKFEGNSLIAGSPAVKIKSIVGWIR